MTNLSDVFLLYVVLPSGLILDRQNLARRIFNMCEVLPGGSFTFTLFADPNLPPTEVPWKWRVYKRGGPELELIDQDGSAGYQIAPHAVAGTWPAPIDGYVTLYVPLDAEPAYIQVQVYYFFINGYSKRVGFADFSICLPAYFLPPGPPAENPPPVGLPEITVPIPPYAQSISGSRALCTR